MVSNSFETSTVYKMYLYTHNLQNSRIVQYIVLSVPMLERVLEVFLSKHAKNLLRLAESRKLCQNSDLYAGAFTSERWQSPEEPSLASTVSAEVQQPVCCALQIRPLSENILRLLKTWKQFWHFCVLSLLKVVLASIRLQVLFFLSWNARANFF